MWAKRQYQHQQRMWNKRWDTDTKHLFLISMNHHRFGSVRFGFSSVLVLALVFWFGSVWLKRNSATSSMTACLALKTEDRRRENGERRIRGAENGERKAENRDDAKQTERMHKEQTTIKAKRKGKTLQKKFGGNNTQTCTNVSPVEGPNPSDIPQTLRQLTEIRGYRSPQSLLGGRFCVPVVFQKLIYRLLRILRIGKGSNVVVSLMPKRFKLPKKIKIYIYIYISTFNCTEIHSLIFWHTA